MSSTTRKCVPQLAVLDLDMCTWSPEMYTLYSMSTTIPIHAQNVTSRTIVFYACIRGQVALSVFIFWAYWKKVRGSILYYSTLGCHLAVEPNYCRSLHHLFTLDLQTRTRVNFLSHMLFVVCYFSSLLDWLLTGGYVWTITLTILQSFLRFCLVSHTPPTIDSDKNIVEDTPFGVMTVGAHSDGEVGTSSRNTYDSIMFYKIRFRFCFQKTECSCVK